MKKSLKKIYRSEKLILQGLYSWELTKNNPESIINYVLGTRNEKKLDINYFNRILTRYPKKEKLINYIIENSVDKGTKFNIIEKTIIKLAVFKLIFEKKLTIKTMVNNSMELSKKFSTKNGYMLINKILNIIIKGYIYNTLLL